MYNGVLPQVKFFCNEILLYSRQLFSSAGVLKSKFRFLRLEG